jgi:hypothetical protein
MSSIKVGLCAKPLERRGGQGVRLILSLNLKPAGTILAIILPEGIFT